MEKIVKGFGAWEVSAEVNNEMLENGFIYMVSGDYYSNRYDSRDGMPVVDGYTHFFTDKEEAEAYAKTQFWFFNSKEQSTVDIVVRRETHKEYEERLEREKKERAEKRANKEKAKADALGMTVEEYKIYKKVENTKKRYAREIEEMEEEIERLKAVIAGKKVYLANH